MDELSARVAAVLDGPQRIVLFDAAVCNFPWQVLTDPVNVGAKKIFDLKCPQFELARKLSDEKYAAEYGSGE